MNVNPLEVYADAGRKAGRARKNRDEACARFYTDWLRRALALESNVWSQMAKKAFDEAYTDEASPSLFR